MAEKNKQFEEERPLLRSIQIRKYGSRIKIGDYIDDDKIGDGVENATSNGSSKNTRKSFVRKLFDAPFNAQVDTVKYVTVCFLTLLFWTFLYAVFDDEAKPGGPLFMLVALTILSALSGWIISWLALPPLVGMLVCGIVLRNVGFFQMSAGYSSLISMIREIALCVILLEAGLGLDAETLQKLSFVVARLAFMPCLTETLATAVGAYFLMDLPWMWGLLLGSILSAVTPAVIVPSLLSLKAKGYGEKKGISTLVIAASSLDDIIAISIFSVLTGMIFSKGDLLHSILQGPIEVVIGLFAGVVWGCVCACFPHHNENNLIIKRSLMVGGGGIVAVLLGNNLNYSGSGPLAAIVLSFIASSCWKWQGWSNTYYHIAAKERYIPYGLIKGGHAITKEAWSQNPVADVYDDLWFMIQPLLFGLIGTDIVFENIEASIIWLAFAVLAFGLFIRFLTCCTILIGANLNIKEIIFVNLAWLPKATVQATLGPIALDLATRGQMHEAIPLAQNVLTVSVLSILITAPIGAIGIALSGPTLLSADKANEDRAKNNVVAEVARVENGR